MFGNEEALLSLELETSFPKPTDHWAVYFTNLIAADYAAPIT